jgi:hypothetical protein
MFLLSGSAEERAELLKQISKCGFVVRLSCVPGQAPSDTRRSFLRYCSRREISVGQTPHPETGELRYGCEFSQVNFSKRTGAPHEGTREVATAYHVTGPVDRLIVLVGEWFIREFHLALSAHVLAAQGQRKKPGSHSQDKHK